jgi:hypothetical protein
MMMMMMMMMMIPSLDMGGEKNLGTYFIQGKEEKEKEIPR